jgi:hypothetical protein
LLFRPQFYPQHGLLQLRSLDLTSMADDLHIERMQRMRLPSIAKSGVFAFTTRCFHRNTWADLLSPARVAAGVGDAFVVAHLEKDKPGGMALRS